MVDHVNVKRVSPASGLRRVFRGYARRWVIVGTACFMLALAGTVGLRGVSALQARGDIYGLAVVPDRPVAIIFGAQIYANGLPSAMLADRIEVGATLYKAGKVKALLLSGDNHIASYNEPEVMRQYALSLGVPDSALVLDYAGFRTYDSCYRARDVFKVSAAILVSQGYHLDRALLICQSLGIDSIGVAADVMRPNGYALKSLLVGELREIPATTLSVVDLLRGKKPTFLGDPLPIFG